MKPKDPDRALARQRERHAEAVRRYQAKRHQALCDRLARGEDIGIPKVNRARRAKREAAGEVYGPYYRWVRDECTDPCALAGGFGGHRCGFFSDRLKMEAHHRKTVGSGGKDAANLNRLCPFGHDLIHDNPPSYAMEVHGVDLDADARQRWARYNEQSEAA